MLGVADYQRQALYARVAGHHGRPLSGPLDDFRLDHHIGGQVLADAGEVVRTFATLWPAVSLTSLGNDQLLALEWWLPGCIAAADWIGSDTAWFSAIPPGPDPADYLAGARLRAGRAVRDAGLTAPDPTDRPLFDVAPRPMQEASASATLPHGPTLAVIGGETGSAGPKRH